MTNASLRFRLPVRRCRPHLSLRLSPHPQFISRRSHKYLPYHQNLHQVLAESQKLCGSDSQDWIISDLASKRISHIRTLHHRYYYQLAFHLWNFHWPFMSCRFTNFNISHHPRSSSERHEICHCWKGYGSDLQTLKDQANGVLKTFHDLDPIQDPRYPRGVPWDHILLFKKCLNTSIFSTTY